MHDVIDNCRFFYLAEMRCSTLDLIAMVITSSARSTRSETASRKREAAAKKLVSVHMRAVFFGDGGGGSIVLRLGLCLVASTSGT